MNYTTIEQSKKLLELGLKPESADMYYEVLTKEIYPQLIRLELTDEHWLHLYPEVLMPCWSLGSLLEIMPKINNNPFELLGEPGHYICGYTLKEGDYISYTGSTPIKAVFDMMVWLLENNYIK